VSPDDFYRWYQHLSPAAYLPDGKLKLLGDIACRRHVTASAAITRDLPSIESAVQAVHDAAQAYIGRARHGGAEMLNREFASEFVLQAEAFRRVKTGRGSPVDMEHVLAAGLMCGHLAADPRSSGTSARDFAANCLGVDAVGFVASYFKQRRLLPAGDDPANLDCTYWRAKALAAAGSVGILWNGSSFRQGDVLLWMAESGVETRPGGPAALIQSVLDVESNVVVGPFTEISTGWQLFCRESRGGVGDDPRSTEYTLVEPVKGEIKHRYWETTKGERVIVVRPFV